MRRSVSLVVMALACLVTPLVARPRVRSISVDQHGRAKVRVSQRQIFDEIGGTGRLDTDVASGVSVLTTALQLPEEAGDVSGNGFLSMDSGSFSLVGNFFYVPVKRKQIKLDIDYRSMENETTAKGHHTISVDYPLSLEHIPATTRDQLSKSSYSLNGHAYWDKYTSGGTNLDLEIRNPDLKKTPSDLHAMQLIIWDKDQVTSFKWHFTLAAGSQFAKLLQMDPTLLSTYMDHFMSQLQFKQRDFSVTNVKKHGKELDADVFLSIEDFRKGIIDLMRFGMELTHSSPKGVDINDFLGAWSRLMDLEFNRLDIDLAQKGDHFQVKIKGTAHDIDKCILGYLSLNEVVQPALVEAGTKEHGLTALDKQITSVQTNRFRQNLIAAGDSNDKGQCDFVFKVAFPKGRLTVQDDFKYDSTVTTYNKASALMHVPVMHQAYSLLTVHTTPKGLQGHYFSEAQGPWFQSQWALYADAAKKTDFKTLVTPDRPDVQDGRLSFALKKRHIDSTGYVKIADLGSFVAEELKQNLGSAKAQVTNVDGSYDADKAPGHILWDVFLQGASPDEVKQALAKDYGGSVKPTTTETITPPTVKQPTVDCPKSLAAAVTADRKTLGVSPWTPPLATESPTPTPPPPTNWGRIFGGLIGLLVLASLAALLLSRRRPSPPHDF